MNQQQINQQAQNSLDNAQHHHKFSLNATQVGNYLAGDYLYMVEMNHAPHPTDKNQTIALNGHSKLFKKVQTSSNDVRQGFSLKNNDNLQFPVSIKNRSENIRGSEVIFEQNTYKQVMLTGSTIQEILKHAKLID